jgi:glycosyltransferase involved in cell wall biosynthesis
MNEPMVSVIMPVFNYQDYICEAIDTILKLAWESDGRDEP